MGKLKTALTFVTAIMITAILVLPACTGKDDPGAAGSEGDSPDYLTIDYDGQEIVISMDDILELDGIEKEVTPVPKDDEEIEARLVKGVLLEDVFREFVGISQKDPGSIRLIAGDGYSIEVPGDLLKTREIILAYEVDGRPLDSWERPLRSIVPDVFEMYWVKNLIKIEVAASRTAEEIEKVIMMESRISYIPDQEYDYYGDADRAVRISDLLLEYGKDPENVFARGVDGLEKNEKPGIFKSAFLKYTGEDSPMFLSPDLPKGMWIKEVLYFTYGSAAYFSAAGGFKVLDTETVEGIESVNLSHILEECSISPSDSYTLTAVDNYSVGVDAGSLDLGYVYLQDNGLPAVHFKDMPESNDIRDLLYIGIAE